MTRRPGRPARNAMSWHRQVLHVARKDARVAGRYLIAWVVLVGLVTAGNLTAGTLSAGGMISPVAVVAAAIVLVAMLVQQDGVTTPYAFWPTRPLDRSAVFGAKVTLAALCVAGPALLAQWILVSSHQAPPSATALVLLDSAATLGVWMALALALAASTPSKRSFALVSLGLVIASSLVMALPGVDRALPSLIGRALGSGPLHVVLTLVLVVVTGGLYSGHPASAWRRGLALLSAGAVLLAVTAGWLSHSVSYVRLEAPAADLHLAGSLTNPEAVEGGLIQYDLHLDGDRFTDSDRLLLAVRGGDLRDGGGVRPAIGAVAVPPSEWTGSGRLQPWGTPASQPAARVTLAPEHAERVRRGEAALVIRGALLVQDVTELPPLPVNSRRWITANGLRVRIERQGWLSTQQAESQETEAGATSPALVLSGIVPAHGPWGISARGFGDSFSIRWASGADTVPLLAQAAFFQPGRLVLSTRRAWFLYMQLEAAPHASDLPPPDAAGVLLIRQVHATQRFNGIITVRNVE